MNKMLWKEDGDKMAEEKDINTPKKGFGMGRKKRKRRTNES